MVYILDLKTHGDTIARLRPLLRRLVSLVGGRLGASLLTLGYTLLIARLATPAELGAAMSGLSAALLVSILLSWNVESGALRYLVAYSGSGEDRKAAGFIRFNLLLLAASSLVLLAGAGLLMATGTIEAMTGQAPLVLGVLAAAPFLALTRSYGKHATALDEVLRGSLPNMLIRPALLCLILGAVYLAGGRVNALHVIVFFLAAAALTALVQYLLLGRALAFVRGIGRDMSDWRKWLTTGVMLAPLLVMRDNLRNVVIVAAALSLDARPVGLLAIAFSLLGLIHFSLKAVDISFSPQLARHVQKGDMQGCRRYLAMGAVLKILAVMTGLLGIYLLGALVLRGFGAYYVDALPVLLILMLIPAADAIFGPAYMVLNITGNQRPILWSSLASAVLVVLATAGGGLAGGVQGAALGAGLSYAGQQFMFFLICRRMAGIDSSVLNLLPRRPDRPRP